MRLIPALALTLFATTENSIAQPPHQEPTDSGITLHITTRETIVDVTVTDDDGNPVHNLKREDFTMLDDGKPQAIRNFEEITPKPSLPPLPSPPNVYTNRQPSSPQPTVNILLLDLGNQAPQDSTDMKQLASSTALQKRTKEAAIQAVNHMPPGTQMAVLLMTNHLRILQSFTSDPSLLVAAINAAPYDLDGRGGNKEAFCSQENSRNHSVLETFDQIAADVATMKGRKNLIWFSVGIWSIVDSLHGSFNTDACFDDYSKDLSQAYDLLTAAQVSVYPIYAGGVGSLREPQLSLEMVADATGGLAYSNTNDLAIGVLKAIDHGASYYTVSYVPPVQNFDGSYHKIAVKVNQPGVHVLSRQGYYAEDITKIQMPQSLALAAPAPGHTIDTQQIMSRGLPTYTDLLFDVQVEPSTAPVKPTDPPILGTLDPKLKEKLKDKRLIRYGFQYAFPARQLAFTDGPQGTHKGALEIDIAAYDTEGKPITSLSQTIQMPLTAERYAEFQTGPFRFFQQLDLPPGPAFLRIGIHDFTSNKIGTIEIPLTVPKTPPDRAANQPTPPTK